jgi:outer membrane lipoprotein-sorting protein
MNFARTFLLALGLVSSAYSAGAQNAVTPAVSIQSAPLTVQQVVANLEQRNAQRAAALQQFEGKRVYRMQYRGFPSDRDAEMVVKVNFRAPNSKEFTVVSQTGSKFVIDHVFKKLLEGELEAAKGDNRSETALTSQNYAFEMAGYESKPEGPQYVLKLVPKTRNKFLYRGTIWVDAKDFAVARIEGEPGKNPSLWIKKTDVLHRYVKVDDFWLPAENRTESVIRLGGKATLSIEYQDYKIIRATQLNAAKRARQTVGSLLEGPASIDGSAILAIQPAKRGAH